MPFLAIPLIIAGTAVSVAGGVMAAGAAKEQGQNEKAMADYNARVAERDAEATRQKAAFDQKRQAERAARIKSSQTANIAAAGGLGSPVAADLAADQASELELENLLIGYEGEIGAQRYESQAAGDRISGNFAAKRGENLATAGYISAGGSLLTGFGSAFGGKKPDYEGAKTKQTGTHVPRKKK